jgi:hypothetical protein
LTNLNPSNLGLIGQDIAGLYIPELRRKVYTEAKDNNTLLTDLVKILYQNPSALDLKNKLFSSEAIQEIKKLIKSNSNLTETYGTVQSVVPIGNGINEELNKYRVKYEVGSRVVLITMNKLGQIIHVISEAE